MFLKQEKPEMDDFGRKKYYGSKGNTLKKFQYFKKICMYFFLTDTLTKMSQNIFAYSFVSEHS